MNRLNLGIQKARHGKGERWKWVVFNLVRIATCLVTIVTLGKYGAQWDTNLLFSDWMDTE